MTSHSALIGEHAGVPAPDPPSLFDGPRSRARAAVSDLRSGLQRCRLLRSSWVASGETRPRPGEPSEAWRGHGALGGGGSWSTEEPHWPTPALGPALPLSVPHRSRTVRNTRLSLRASPAQDSRRPWEPFSLPRALPIQSTLPTWGAFPSARWASGPPGLGAPLTTAPTAASYPRPGPGGPLCSPALENLPRVGLSPHCSPASLFQTQQSPSDFDPGALSS